MRIRPGPGYQALASRKFLTPDPLHAHASLNWLLIFLPLNLLLEFAVHPADWVLFLTAAIAIVPLAALIGQSTENLSAITGPTLGGLLNATFGNATELIIAFFALRAGKIEVVKASITGSMISNMLLGLGLALARRAAIAAAQLAVELSTCDAAVLA